MNRTLLTLALALVLASCAASAQTSSPTNPCGYPEPLVNPHIYIDWRPGLSKVTCAPAPFGKGTLPTIRYNAAGIHAWAWCPTPTGGWGLMQGAVTWDRALQLQLVADAAAIASAADPVDALNRIMDKNVNLPLADPSLTPVWCPNWKEVWVSKPAPVVVPPAATAWIVVPALSGSRPLFSVVGGTLVATTQRVPALTIPATACDCAAAKLDVPPALYCAPTGKAPLVALCKVK